MGTQNASKAFPVQEVVAVACAIFREHGYKKKSDIAYATVVSGESSTEVQKSNSQLIYSHFFNPQTWSANVAEQDQNTAKEIVEYLQGLSFKTMERGLTDFETNVLKFVTSTEVGKDSLGIAASLPKIYLNKLEQDKWEVRESELASHSEYLGVLKTRGEFEVMIENVRYIARTGSHLYCASVDGKHILKFFSDQKIADQGEKVCLSGYVKSHAESRYHGGKETMINRLKIHVTDPENSKKN